MLFVASIGQDQVPININLIFHLHYWLYQDTFDESYLGLVSALQISCGLVWHARINIKQLRKWSSSRHKLKREAKKESVHLLLYSVYPFTVQSRGLTMIRSKPFENIVGKGENAGNQHFLLFPQCFLSYERLNLCEGYIYIYFVTCKRFQFGPV